MSMKSSLKIDWVGVVNQFSGARKRFISLRSSFGRIKGETGGSRKTGRRGTKCEQKDV